MELTERRAVVLALLLAALLVTAGGLYGVQLGARLRYVDEQDYVGLAHSLATSARYAGATGKLTAYRPPGYPAVLAVVALLGGGVPLMRFMNFIALAGSALVLFHLVRRHATPVAGLVAVLLLCAYPVAFYTAGLLYPQTLGGFLLLLLVWAASTAQGGFGFTAMGAVLGLLVLTLPVTLALVPVLVLWLWRIRRLPASGLALILILGLLPAVLWSTRNSAVFGRPVFISTNSGINLLLGNSPDSGPDTGTRVDLSSYREQARGLDEAAASAFYRDAALRHLRTRPLRSAGLYVRKVLNHFSFTNRLKTEGQQRAWMSWVMFLTYGPLLVLGLLRLVDRTLPWTHPELLLVCMYIAMALAYAVFFTRIRFRVPFDMLLIATVSLYLGRRLQHLRRD